MVIFIAALSILGIQPGPTLLKAEPSLPYSMLWVMAIAGLLSCAVGLIITPWLSRATSVRGPVMMPIIITLAVLGSFAAVTGFAGVVELGVFAVVGVVLRKVGYSVAAMTIGLVLGGTFADNVHLTQSIYGWSFIVHSPLADVFLVISIALLVLITWRGRRGRAVITPERAARGPRSPHPVLEPVTEAVIAVVSIIYMIIALGLPRRCGRRARHHRGRRRRGGPVPARVPGHRDAPPPDGARHGGRRRDREDGGTGGDGRRAGDRPRWL